MSAKDYNHQAIEAKWQEQWQRDELYKTPDQVAGKENFYALFEFPYPSGNLHVGHWYAYAPTDVIARYHRMTGKNVLFPIGFDSFGLPAENAAIKRGLDPRGWTYQNIATMTNQIKSIGTSVDWSREVRSSDSDYYQWTQYIFTKFLEKGLAYEALQEVNYCPGCKTVLANEQVVNGECERCGSMIQKRTQKEWTLRITDYAEALLNDLDTLDWPEEIKASQRAWIGKSEGANFKFKVKTEKEPHKFALLHGFGRKVGEEDDYMSWLKKELESQGHAVEYYQLPNTENPNVQEQVEFVLKNYNLDDNTTIVAQSLGTIIALKVLEKIKVKNILLTGAFIDYNFKIDFKPDFVNSFDWIFDWNTINSNYYQATVLADKEDFIVANQQTDEVAKYLTHSIYKKVTASAPHFKSPREQVVLENLLPNIEVFTTRPDTLYGVTYLVLSPEHAQITNNQSQITNWGEVENYIRSAKVKSDIERSANKKKTGVLIEGVTAVHPATGEELPIYIADYVLGSYGTGAIMAVPAHDERDNEFAHKYDLPIKQVISISHKYCDGINDYQPEKETIKRQCVDIIIEHPTEDKFLIQIENTNGKEDKHFVGGGIEEGESELDAVASELIEETGFTNFEIKNRVFEKLSCLGYRHTKDKNIDGVTSFYHVKLKDLNQVESEIDQGLHTIEWVEKNQVIKNLSWVPHNLAWEIFLNHSVFSEVGYLINSDKFNSLSSEEAAQKITKEFGETATTYRLRDWSIGRQRYWGCPIPVVYDPDGQAHPVPSEHLPWTLPTDVDHTPDGTAPLARSKELKQRTEDIFGIGWTPAMDTMDTFVDSSWYYIRYTDSANKSELAANSAQQAWLPVDFYSGGAEHTTMHLLYARFFYKAMQDCGLIDSSLVNEPFKQRLNRSLILGPDGNKMSKSKGNVIDPDAQVENVGADAIRTYLCFMGPYNQVSHYPWDSNGLVGVRKFLERVNGLAEYLVDDEIKESNVEMALHKAIKGVTSSIEQKKLNTGVSSLMILANVIEEHKQVNTEQLRTMVQLIAPFAPHLAEEWWSQLNGTGSVHETSWPAHNSDLLATEQVVIPVQINGKKIGQITAPRNAAQALVEKLARGDAKLRIRITGEPKKVIYVKNRILNLVIDKKR